MLPEVRALDKPWTMQPNPTYLQTRKLRPIEVKLLVPYGVHILSLLLASTQFLHL